MATFDAVRPTTPTDMAWWVARPRKATRAELCETEFSRSGICTNPPQPTAPTTRPVEAAVVTESCRHWFVLPEPPAPPLGICAKCGEQRLHSNCEVQAPAARRGPPKERQTQAHATPKPAPPAAPEATRPAIRLGPAQGRILRTVWEIAGAGWALLPAHTHNQSRRLVALGLIERRVVSVRAEARLTRPGIEAVTTGHRNGAAKGLGTPAAVRGPENARELAG